MRIFYTAEFLPAADLLPWFVLCVFGRVVSWPVGFVQAAKGATRWMFISQTLAFIVTIGLTFVFIRTHGLFGVALALVVYTPIGMILSYCIAHSLSSFKWSSVVVKLMIISSLLVSIGMLVQRNMELMPGLCVGTCITAGASVFCFRGITERLGADNKLVKMLFRVPGGRWLSGV